MTPIYFGYGGANGSNMSSIKFGTINIAKAYYGEELIHGTASASFTISLVSDDSGGSSSYKAVIQLGTLPAGATGYKVEMAGTQDSNSTAYTGVLIFITSPSNNTTYQANQGSPSSTGGQNMNNSAKYLDSSKRLELRQANGNGLTGGTVKVTAIDGSNNPVGTESSALSIVIAEDG